MIEATETTVDKLVHDVKALQRIVQAGKAWLAAHDAAAGENPRGAQLAAAEREAFRVALMSGGAVAATHHPKVPV